VVRQIFALIPRVMIAAATKLFTKEPLPAKHRRIGGPLPGRLKRKLLNVVKNSRLLCLILLCAAERIQSAASRVNSIPFVRPSFSLICCRCVSIARSLLLRSFVAYVSRVSPETKEHSITRQTRTKMPTRMKKSLVT
jgi:hypothetical protein